MRRRRGSRKMQHHRQDSRLETHVVQDHPGASQRQAPRRSGAGAGDSSGTAHQCASDRHARLRQHAGSAGRAGLWSAGAGLGRGGGTQGGGADRRHVRRSDGQPAVRGGVAVAEGVARRSRRRRHGARPLGRPDRGRPDRSRLGPLAADGFPRAPGARERPAGPGRPLCRPLRRDRPQRRDRLEVGPRIGPRRVRCAARS